MLLEWSEEFSIKNQHLDEQHKLFLRYVKEAFALSQSEAPNKPQHLKMLIANIITYTKEHFKDEETYMKHAGYPFLPQQQEKHKQFVLQIKNILANMADIDKVAHDLYLCLKDWFLTHILQEDKKIETYRNKVRDIQEIPFTLPTQVAIIAETKDLKNVPFVKYVCFCYLKAHQVPEPLHLQMKQDKTFIRCQSCKQPIVKFDENLEKDDVYETLAKKYFKQF